MEPLNTNLTDIVGGVRNIILDACDKEKLRAILDKIPAEHVSAAIIAVFKKDTPVEQAPCSAEAELVYHIHHVFGYNWFSEEDARKFLEVIKNLPDRVSKLKHIRTEFNCSLKNAVRFMDNYI